LYYTLFFGVCKGEMIQMPQLVDQSASFIPPQQFSGTVSAAIHSLVSRQTAST
jgi:hypothetical protein